jgi:hypothetical protein
MPKPPCDAAVAQARDTTEGFLRQAVLLIRSTQEVEIGRAFRRRR